MAGWKTDKDIARDMDILSGIQSPEEKIKSYSSWGRGTLNTLSDVSTFPEPQEKTKVEEFQWYPEGETLGKLPDSIGRGKKLELLKANIYRSKEMEVHEQLREVMGPGYSNDYIEESFRKRLGVKNEHKSLPVEQFQDSEEMQTASDKFVEGEGESENVVLNTADSTSHKAEVPKHSKRRGRKRYRNALLEGLERRNPGIFENECADTNGTSSTTKTGPMFGTKSSNIPPACYLPGKSLLTGSPEKNENSFEYKESEFPHL